MLQFLTTFAQPSVRLKNFLGGWLWVLGIKKGLVECATVCVKSVVILEAAALKIAVVVLLAVFPQFLLW